MSEQPVQYDYFCEELHHMYLDNFGLSNFHCLLYRIYLVDYLIKTCSLDMMHFCPHNYYMRDELDGQIDRSGYSSVEGLRSKI